MSVSQDGGSKAVAETGNAAGRDSTLPKLGDGHRRTLQSFLS